MSRRGSECRSLKGDIYIFVYAHTEIKPGIGKNKTEIAFYLFLIPLLIFFPVYLRSSERTGAEQVGHRWVEGSASGANVVMNASWRVKTWRSWQLRPGDVANRNVIIGAGQSPVHWAPKGRTAESQGGGNRGVNRICTDFFAVQLLNSLMAPPLVRVCDFLGVWKVARKMDRISLGKLDHSCGNHQVISHWTYW